MSLDAPDAHDPADLAAHSLDFWLTTEDLPKPENHVEVTSDGRIRLSYIPMNLEAHKRHNVYVVVSSLFVSSTAVNPTLTIIANALRVADHIASR